MDAHKTYTKTKMKEIDERREKKDGHILSVIGRLFDFKKHCKKYAGKFNRFLAQIKNELP